MDINYLYDKMHQCISQNSPVFTDFLDLAELKLLKTRMKIDKDCFYIEYKAFLDDERRMVGFFPDDYQSFMNQAQMLALFPVKIVKVTAYLKSQITHRDVLGAVIGLGLNRRLFGDIILTQKEVFIACHERAEKLILDELVTIGRVNVHTEKSSIESTLELEPAFQELSVTVASLRIDNVVKAITNLARSNAVLSIKNGHIKVNQVNVVKLHHQLDEGDVLSVKGKGKFKIIKTGEFTKKGRIPLLYRKYI